MGTVELETVQGLREYLIEHARRAQQESASWYQAAEIERDSGSERAAWVQERAAHRYQVMVGFLDWLRDEPFLVEWCGNINRAKEREERRRVSARAAEELRRSAMTPAEREYEDERRAVVEWTRAYIDGLIARGVQ